MPKVCLSISDTHSQPVWGTTRRMDGMGSSFSFLPFQRPSSRVIKSVYNMFFLSGCFGGDGMMRQHAGVALLEHAKQCYFNYRDKRGPEKVSFLREFSGVGRRNFWLLLVTTCQITTTLHITWNSSGNKHMTHGAFVAIRNPASSNQLFVFTWREVCGRQLKQTCSNEINKTPKPSLNGEKKLKRNREIFEMSFTFPHFRYVGMYKSVSTYTIIV